MCENYNFFGFFGDSQVFCYWYWIGNDLDFFIVKWWVSGGIDCICFGEVVVSMIQKCYYFVVGGLGEVVVILFDGEE